MRSQGEGSRAVQADGLLIAGRYEVLEKLERPGGLAGYRVRHLLLDSTLLLTAVPEDVADDPRRLAHVQAAVRAAGRLRHDHVVPVLDLVQDDGRTFIVEPLAEGAPLDRVIAASPLDAPDALHVARQLADALAYAHAAGIVHGTVCPAHVLVETGTPPRASLFGFARAALAEPGAPIPVRFLRYTAPERLTGTEADVAGDIFALGQVLFELFDGRPFLDGHRHRVETVLRDGTAPFVPRFCRVVPAGLTGLVARTIRRAPAERQQQMADVRADLDACLRSVEQQTAEAADVPVEPSPVVASLLLRPVRRPVASVCAGVVRPRPALRPVVALERRAPVARPVRDVPTPRWRLPWPSPVQREATFPSRVLVRASRPHAPLGSKLLAIVAMFTLLWEALPFALPPSPPPVAVEQPIAAAGPGPGAAVDEPPPVEAVTEPVPARVEPPRIEGHEPASERLTVGAGETTRFRVWAAGDDRFLYAWLLDGRKVGDGPEWRMVAPSPPRAAMHVVEAEVTDAAGVATARIAWSVEVEPSPAVAPRRAPARPARPRR